MPATPEKSLDLKLARILADPACGDFLLADAKDADMAFGLAGPGLAPGGVAGQGPFKSIHEYRDSIRELVAEGLVDIMLMSASTCELLAIEEGLFDQSGAMRHEAGPGMPAVVFCAEAAPAAPAAHELSQVSLALDP